jgi:hypothetical protein
VNGIELNKNKEKGKEGRGEREGREGSEGEWMTVKKCKSGGSSGIINESNESKVRMA